MSASGPRRRAIIAALPVAAGLAACTSSPAPTAARRPRLLHRASGRRGRGRDRADRPRTHGRPGRGGAPGRPRGGRDRLHRHDARRPGRPEHLRRRPVEQPAHVGPGPDGPVHPARPGGQDRLAQAHHRLAGAVHEGNQPARQAGRRRLHETSPRPSRTRSWPRSRSASSPACCSSTPSRACTPAPSTAATGTWPAGRRSGSPATSSRAATPPTRWSGPTATTRSARRHRQHRRRRRRPQAPRRALNP